jgi:hypothetical protein
MVVVTGLMNTRVAESADYAGSKSNKATNGTKLAMKDSNSGRSPFLVIVTI